MDIQPDQKNMDTSIELEENHQAVTVDTCITVASHLLNRVENFTVIVFIDIKGRIQSVLLYSPLDMNKNNFFPQDACFVPTK